MKQRNAKFFNLRDMIFAAIIIALMFFTFVPVEQAEKEGGPAFGTMEKTGQEMLGKPAAETPAPATAE